MSVTALRLRLLELGYEPVACVGKSPVITGWQSIELTRTEIERWAHAPNTGIRTKNTPAVDIDIRDEAIAERVQQTLLNIIRAGGTILRRVGQPPKRLIPFRCEAPFRKLFTPWFKVSPDDPDTLRNRVEVLGDGQQFVCDGIHPDTREPYRWADGVDLAAVPRDRLPLLDEATARELVAEAARIMTDAGWHSPKVEPKPSATPWQPRDGDDERIAETLSHIPADDRDTWFVVGAILKDHPGGRDLWDRWSQSSSKYDADDQERVWQSIGTSTKRATIATLFHLAQQHGWVPPKSLEKPAWSAAGLAISMFDVDEAWPTFRAWCKEHPELPLEPARIEFIFNTILEKELAQ